jgi:hypothetical protein
VNDGTFPTEANTVGMADEDFEQFAKEVEG